MHAKQEPFDGIFHPESKGVFRTLEEYMQWYSQYSSLKQGPWIGVLTHRHNWLKGNLAIEQSLIAAFENQGLRVLPVFSYASSEEHQDIKDFDTVVQRYFCKEGRPIIEGLVNFQMIAALGNGSGSCLFEKGVQIFKQLGIPVFRPLASYQQTQEQWQDNLAGLSGEIFWLFTPQERMGMIEPIAIGFRDQNQMLKPVEDRILRFVQRVNNGVKLRRASNSEKKLALMIHCAPCSGVEATIGTGVGLDVFESTALILKELKSQGYTVENPPENGGVLKAQIMERKAYQDFRWTTVESIAAAGGVLHTMGLSGPEGYLNHYHELPLSLQKQVQETWGPAPGEGMVLDDQLAITGLSFGNVVVMVQPKRGCYGAKCTGEVCKLLYDPQCPPPHHYLATYRYIETCFKAHGVVHIGTGGSLEYLPGKTNGLSAHCWPDAILGNLLNFYVYNAGVGVEGTGAKRRNSAVVLDYLPSSFAVDTQTFKIIQMIGEYLEAQVTNPHQAEHLKTAVKEQVQTLPWTEKVMHTASGFEEGVVQVKETLVQAVNNNRVQSLHTLGVVPQGSEAVGYIKEAIDGSSPWRKPLQKLCGSVFEYHKFVTQWIHHVLFGHIVDNPLIECVPPEILEGLIGEILEAYQSLKTVAGEIPALMKALEGNYVEPGMAGIPADGLGNILPTGRNFYLMNMEKVPTPQAYAIGCQMAEKLLAEYQKEAGALPEKVAMNMISTDISMTKGEQLGQILNLMGIQPVWNENGKVEGLEPIALTDLNRPRIDVMVRISGVLRDAYPEAVKMMDDAVLLASALEEPLEQNYVRKNTLQMVATLKEMNRETDIERWSTVRIFGDKPGAYGAGVDLALKASAWKTDEDIAKIFTAFSGYAYGNQLSGNTAGAELLANVKGADLSFEKTISKRYDILASGFAASVQGGFDTLKNTLTGSKLRQYHGTVEDTEAVRVSTMRAEIEKTLGETFFNPLWKHHIQQQGYTGAAELMRRVQSVFDWQSLCRNIADQQLDQLVETYITDPEMTQWFQTHNPYAIEEMTRRFLELHQRQRWVPNPQVLSQLKRRYIEIEGDMEGLMETETGEYQGGTIEVIGHKDIDAWAQKMEGIETLFKGSNTELKKAKEKQNC